MRRGGPTVQTGFQSTAQRGPLRIPLWLGFCLFLAIAVFFLWEEHRAHLLGAAPYVLLLLCPIIIPRPGRQVRAKSSPSLPGVTL